MEKILTLPPTGGAVVAFRGRRGDRLKLLYFDGQGFCLFKSLSPCIGGYSSKPADINLS
ncbi:IS66 family insertion sequence element accessory protein TnpB [Mesorhizobium sp. M0011]|uniref:IS66 family insertion sequence element accessory protein TnpB n=1 Tax=Mesorhizobium sp. M0011 TaxID=2956839 RepID=UPI00333E1465